MLDNKTIINAINNNEIEIYVSFDKEDETSIDDKTERPLLSSRLKSNLYSDRLKLTIGPIIKILDNKSFSRKYRYKNYRDCYDLRQSDSKYILEPGESIVVLTNERIKLNGKYACLIVPRISMSDVGIAVTTAYVDPYYNGIMRLHLTNLSNNSYELTFLEAIAQCFFFELQESVSEEFRDEFSTKSVFYGQTWNGILNTDRNPFPTKKDSTNVKTMSNFRYQLNIIWSFVKKHSLIFLLLTNIFAILCGAATLKNNLTKYSTTIEQLASSFKPIASEIVINSGETYGEKEITVKYSKSDIVTVLCDNDSISYKIISGDNQNESKIIFSYNLSSKTTNIYEVSFTYAIVRRVE